MTHEEAIGIFKDDYTLCGDCVGANCGKCLKEAKKLAIEALEMQMPKKPVMQLHENRVPGEQEEYYCPTCGEWITWDWKWKCCAFCGQAIDWSDENDI